MPVIIKVRCVGCERDVVPKAINAITGVCGRCTQRGRDVLRGYGLYQRVSEYRCGLCGRQSGECTIMSVVIEGVLCPVDTDCLLTQETAYPEAVAYAWQWQAELRVAHAAEDAEDQ